jgi:hypothetical protein
VAKTKKKRRRKHRGTQGGGVARAPKGRPRNRAEARARAKSQRRQTREPRGLRPPSWTGAIGKGALASLLFFALFAGIFHRPLGASAGFAAFMLGFYVPLSYYLDGFFYRRRMRQLEQKRQQGGAG